MVDVIVVTDESSMLLLPSLCGRHGKVHNFHVSVPARPRLLQPSCLVPKPVQSFRCLGAKHARHLGIRWPETFPRSLTRISFVDAYAWLGILGDPGADSRGERQLKRAGRNRCELKPGESVSFPDGRKSPWEHTLNGLAQQPICVLASDWAQILRHFFFWAQTAISLFKTH